MGKVPCNYSGKEVKEGVEDLALVKGTYVI